MSADDEERRVLLTGPASERAAKRWIDAVHATPGWNPVHLPLVHIVGRAIDPRHVRDAPGLVAVTSQNALPALKRLWEQREDVKRAPHAAVGAATARAMRALGVIPVLVGEPGDEGAVQLAKAIVDRTEDGQTVLWPRGDRATELHERLVAAGRRVNAPVAYRTEDVEDSVLPGRLSAAFFASPSAVGVWLRTTDAPRVVAIAIGQTTHAELAPEYARFTRIVRLAQPNPRALADALSQL